MWGTDSALTLMIFDLVQIGLLALTSLRFFWGPGLLRRASAGRVKP